MRILLLTVGTRGDVEPFCALAFEFLQRGIAVEFFLESKWVCLAEAIQNNNNKNNVNSQQKEGLLTIHALPFDNAAFFRRESNTKNADNASNSGSGDKKNDNRSHYLENLIRIQREYVWPSYPMIYTVAKNCQRIVSNSFTTYLICHLSKTLQIPACLLHLQPLLPNQLFPSYRLCQKTFVSSIVHYFDTTNKARQRRRRRSCTGSQPGGDDGGDDTYYLDYHPEYQFEVNPDLYLALLENGIIVKHTATSSEQKGSVSQQQQAEPFEWEEMKQILAGYHPQVTIVNAYNQCIIPPLAGTPGLGPNVLDVGSLANNYIDSTFEEVPPQLTKFLKRHHQCIHSKTDSSDTNNNNIRRRSPIVCIGFGSMPLRRRQVDMVMATVHHLTQKEKQPVILVGDALLLQQDDDKDNGNDGHDLVLHLSSIPYPYLLPFCSMMICHGGAGVIQAALRAGCPCLICPILGDQFALGALIEGLNFGRQVLWIQGNRIMIGGGGGGGDDDGVIISHHDMIREIQYIQSSQQIQTNCQQISEKILQQDSGAGGSPAATLADFVVVGQQQYSTS